MFKKTGVGDRRLMITKNSIMMLVLLVIIFLAVFAWYHIQGGVGANGITVSAANPDEVEIAVEKDGAIGSYSGSTFTAGKWSSSATFDTSSFEFSNDVTSNGLVFLIPGFSSTEENEVALADARTNGKIVNVNAAPTTAKSNLALTTAERNEGKTPDYYSAKFYLRSRNQEIFVKPSAYLAMQAESDGEAFSTSSSVRKSSYGDFSSDVLVAAMRVSLTGGAVSSVNASTYAPTRATDVNECPFVWVPRPDLFLKIPYGTSDTDWQLQTGVTKTTSIYRLRNESDTEHYPGTSFTGETYLHHYYAERSGGGVEYKTAYTNLYPNASDNDSYDALVSDPSKSFTLTGTSNDVPTLGVGREITDFTTTASAVNMKIDPSEEDTADYYVYEYNINLWIEGTDTEARRAMDSGQFSLFIEFGNSV